MNKYKNIKTNGFDSKKEAKRYQELLLLEKAGEISYVRCQPKYLLQKSFVDKRLIKHQAIYYIADFEYKDKIHNWEIVVEDTKGFRTDVYKLKKKLLLKKYNVWFLES